MLSFVIDEPKMTLKGRSICCKYLKEKIKKNILQKTKRVKLEVPDSKVEEANKLVCSKKLIWFSQDEKPICEVYGLIDDVDHFCEVICGPTPKFETIETPNLVTPLKSSSIVAPILDQEMISVPLLAFELMEREKLIDELKTKTKLNFTYNKQTEMLFFAANSKSAKIKEKISLILSENQGKEWKDCSFKQVRSLYFALEDFPEITRIAYAFALDVNTDKTSLFIYGKKELIKVITKKLDSLILVAKKNEVEKDDPYNLEELEDSDSEESISDTSSVTSIHSFLEEKDEEILNHLRKKVIRQHIDNKNRPEISRKISDLQILRKENELISIYYSKET